MKMKMIIFLYLFIFTLDASALLNKYLDEKIGEPADSSSFILKSQFAMERFMSWYVPQSGVWIGHLSYPPDWCRANGVEVMANYILHTTAENISNVNTEQVQLLWTVLKDVQDNQGNSFYQSAEYFDDILWWSLAYTRCHDVAVLMKDTKRAELFLTTAMSINDVIAMDSWDEKICGGGAYWSRTSTYKNAITNELYFASSARLARMTGRSVFLDRANHSLEWFLSSGMIGSDNLIVDGLTSSCVATGSVYTYNQGVILGAFSELYLLSKNTHTLKLIQLGSEIATSVEEKLTTEKGILSELSCGDGALFKGIYTRYLRYFIDFAMPAKSEYFQRFLEAQANSVWALDRDIADGYFGKNWSGPPDFNFHNLQVSAIDALSSASPYAAAAHVESAPRAASQCSSHGYYVDGSCACFPRFSGFNCENEINWVEYYSGSELSLTSRGAGRLLCVQTTNTSVVATLCLDDDLMSRSYFKVIKVADSSTVYIMSSSLPNYYLVSSGPGANLLALYLSTDDDLLQYPGAAFWVDIAYEGEGSSFESVFFKTYYGGYVTASGLVRVVDGGEATDSSKFIANKAQQCN